MGNRVQGVRGGTGRTSLAQQAAEWMQQQIRDDVWPLDSRIPTETELAGLLGIGRSTVREATQSLVTTGMLEAAPGRGTFVRSRNAVNAVLTEYLNRQPLPDLLELRRALDVEAAGLAAERRTDADLSRLRLAITEQQSSGPDGWAACGTDRAPGSFHTDVFASARNALLTELHRATITVVARAAHAGQLAAAPDGQRDKDHVQIYQAIDAGDPNAARAAAKAHVERDFRPASGGAGSGRLSALVARA